MIVAQDLSNTANLNGSTESTASTRRRTTSPFVHAFESDPLGAAIEYYACCLPNHAKAVAKVAQLFGHTAEQARTLSIGFSDRTLGIKLPPKALKAGAAIRAQLESIGLYKPNGRETLRGCITIPLKDATGNWSGIRAIRCDQHGSKATSFIQVGAGFDYNGRFHPEDLPVPHGATEAVPRDVTVSETVCKSEPATVTEVAVASVDSAVAPIVSAAAPIVSAVAPIVSAVECQLAVHGEQIQFTRGDRQYRVRGLDSNTSSLAMRVSIAASRGDGLHVDTIDLLRASSRYVFVRAAAAELGCHEDTIKKDVGLLLMQLETLQFQKLVSTPTSQVLPPMTDSETNDALSLLRDPNLITRIVHDMERCGMVGESFNKLATYLAVTSRKLDRPLALLIQSSSSAGKTTLMDAVLAMTPPEELLRLSNLTPQSLYYMNANELQHRTLAVSEDHGLSEVAYALKLLQSEGQLTHASVTKGTDGRTVTELHTVKGPVQLLLTSTNHAIDEELANRCLILTVDETTAQTRSIQDRQRSLLTREGDELRRRSIAIQTLHQNAQRLIRPMTVYIPFADQLTFASDRTRMRRDHTKYLTLIQAIALLHQHQRPIHIDQDGNESIDVVASDVALANRLIVSILGQSLDELSPQTRLCLKLLDEYVTSHCQRSSIGRNEFRFTRRGFRESVGWTDFQIRIHFERLVQLEYLITHRGKQGCRYVYELAYNANEVHSNRFISGLCDPGKLT